jgi:hypothetical protein
LLFGILYSWISIDNRVCGRYHLMKEVV